MNPVPYVFYSYSISKEDEPIPTFSHAKLFHSVQKTPVAYNKAEPSEADKDTQLVSLKDRNKDKKQVISFYISRRISQRKIRVYDGAKDEFNETLEKTSDYTTALVVVMPHIGKMAVADKTGEHDINSRSALGRLKKIIGELEGSKFLYEYAATEKDVRRAFKVWSIDEINFNARPFNPHPSTPGDQLSDLMKANNGMIRGKISGRGEPLKNLTKGFVNEILGLGSKGYAQLGAKGKTEEGFGAVIDKVEPHENVNTPRKIRIFMPPRIDMEAHIEDIVNVMTQLYE